MFCRLISVCLALPALALSNLPAAPGSAPLTLREGSGAGLASHSTSTTAPPPAKPLQPSPIPPATPPAANPLDGDIPNFEPHYELHYQFLRADSEDVDPAAPSSRDIFRFTAKGTETIRRDGRESVMDYTGLFGVAMTSNPAAVKDSVPKGAEDLSLRLTALDVRCDAGRGSWAYLLDDAGITETRPAIMGGTVKHDLNKPFLDTLTIAHLLTRTGNLRVSNGALRAAPSNPPLINALHVEWLAASIPMLIPPLPTAAMDTGREWSAGSPMILGIFAEPAIIRSTYRFEFYDADTGVAEVSWHASARTLPLKPRPGIHHVRADALATAEVNGTLRLHVATGRILSTAVHVDSTIMHAQPGGAEITFSMQFEMKPALNSLASAGS